MASILTNMEKHVMVCMLSKQQPMPMIWNMNTIEALKSLCEKNFVLEQVHEDGVPFYQVTKEGYDFIMSGKDNENDISSEDKCEYAEEKTTIPIRSDE